MEKLTKGGRGEKGKEKGREREREERRGDFLIL